MVLTIMLIPRIAGAYNVWTPIDRDHVPSKGDARLHAKNYIVYTLDQSSFRDLLLSSGDVPESSVLIDLPLPDGTFSTFKVWQKSVLPPALAAKYPAIKTFTAVAANNQAVTAKLDFTAFGFHAMIFDGEHTAFIDPYNNILDENLYMCHYKKDETRPYDERMQCEVKNNGENELQGDPMPLDQTVLPAIAAKTIGGFNLLKYRLALSCSNQYAAAVSAPNVATKALVLSAMTTSMNRVNGVFERELSITMEFVPNDDTLIYITAAGDPFNFYNNNALSLLGLNQTMCDSLIGNANYDIGHVFITGSGGYSDLGIICEPGSKAKSTTGSATPTGDGFDIDYVVHEMGHEFGGNHTFNNNHDGSCCCVNIWAPTAYEPGSGSTIMAYAGICAPDDIQPHSDDYFHSANILEIYNATIIGTTCGIPIPVNNHSSALAPFMASYTIPYKTPFELMSPGAVDSVTTTTTYCWDQWDLGDIGKRLDDTYFNGPIFRSFAPVLSTVRVFPRIDSVLKGTLSYVTTENAKGEKAPDTARSMTFRLMLRSIHWGNGCFQFPDDSINVDAVSTGAAANYEGFKVTSPSTAVNWTGGTGQNVTWNVVGTNAAPVSCDSVNVYLSVDGGYNWPYWVGKYSNNGSAAITVPNVATTSAARLKVKGNNNIFFNVNGSNFTVTLDPSLPVTDPNNPINETVPNLAVNNILQQGDDVKVYPVPANDIVYVEATGAADVSVLNNVGQRIWSGQMNNKLEIPVGGWAKGLYYMQLAYHENGKRIVKPILIK